MEGVGGHTLPLTNTTEVGGCKIHAGSFRWEPENKPAVKAALNYQESLILHECHGARQPEHESLSNKEYFIYC